MQPTDIELFSEFIRTRNPKPLINNGILEKYADKLDATAGFCMSCHDARGFIKCPYAARPELICPPTCTFDKKDKGDLYRFKSCKCRENIAIHLNCFGGHNLMCRRCKRYLIDIPADIKYCNFAHYGVLSLQALFNVIDTKDIDKLATTLQLFDNYDWVYDLTFYEVVYNSFRETFDPITNYQLFQALVKISPKCGIELCENDSRTDVWCRSMKIFMNGFEELDLFDSFDVSWIFSHINSYEQLTKLIKIFRNEYRIKPEFNSEDLQYLILRLLEEEKDAKLIEKCAEVMTDYLQDADEFTTF